MKTAKEVAEIFNVYHRTVHLWIKQGKMRATKVGKKYQISQEEIDYIKKNGLRGNA
jgi:excisionase family DNA binding protein